MNTRLMTLGAIGALTIATLNVPAALATLPDDQTISYEIYEEPGDQESGVVLTFELSIKAVSVDGNIVEWIAHNLVIEEYNASGAVTARWLDPVCTFSSGNGKWAVEHDDPGSPALIEFENPPLLEGAAEPQTPSQSSDPELIYSLAGAYCDAECQQFNSGLSTALEFETQNEGHQSPRYAGVDETVGITHDDGGSPPPPPPGP
jgi:hypothetical protein